MIIDLGIMQMFFAYLLVLLMIVFIQNKGLRKDIFIGTLKMSIQLLIIGLLLIVLFKLPNIYGVLYLFVMISFAIYTLKKRTDHICVSKVIGLSVGPLVCLIYFIILVVSPPANEMLNASYLIPIFGMILGNSLTAIVIASNRFESSMQDDYDKIQYKLELGVLPTVALKEVVIESLKAALSPTITSMFSIGLVSLPGMMTGQILSQTNPIIAIKYQIAIMIIILTSSLLTSIIYLVLETRTYITKNGTIDFNKIK